MLVLVIVFLCGLYIAKIFFPQEFVMAIENEQFIKIGNFVDSNLWAMFIVSGITSFATYWLYCCACSHRLYLSAKECLYIALVVVLVRVFYLFDGNIANAIQLSAFIVLPSLTNGQIKECAIVYSFHCLSQTLSLSIRNLAVYLTNSNFVVIMALSIESYLWQILFYILFNYKDKEI